MTRERNAIAAVEAFILREQRALKRKQAASADVALKRPARGRPAAPPEPPAAVAPPEPPAAVAPPEPSVVPPAAVAPLEPPVVPPAAVSPPEPCAVAAAAVPVAALPELEAAVPAAAPVLTAVALATPVSLSELSLAEQLALGVLSSASFQFLSQPPNANHIMNPSKNTFPVKAKGGGNFRNARVSSRELSVELDEQKLAKWTPKKYYQEKMHVLRDFANQSEVETSIEGIVHPVLRFSTLKLSAVVRQELVNNLFGYTKTPEILFRKFLCTIAIRSRMVKDGYTWEFDPHAWNREGYRLVPGCDSKGKPRVTFV